VDVFKWLIDNDFDKEKSLKLQNYKGKDLLYIEKEICVEVFDRIEGFRLFNAIPTLKVSFFIINFKGKKLS
jgi:hypothetical protein